MLLCAVAFAAAMLATHGRRHGCASMLAPGRAAVSVWGGRAGGSIARDVRTHRRRARGCLRTGAACFGGLRGDGRGGGVSGGQIAERGAAVAAALAGVVAGALAPVVMPHELRALAHLPQAPACAARTPSVCMARQVCAWRVRHRGESMAGPGGVGSALADAGLHVRAALLVYVLKAQVHELARGLREAVEQPARVGCRALRVRVSACSALYPRVTKRAWRLGARSVAYTSSLRPRQGKQRGKAGRKL